MTELNELELGKLIERVEHLTDAVERLSKKVEHLEDQISYGRGVAWGVFSLAGAIGAAISFFVTHFIMGK